ncbi:MAG: hypothetical protein R3B09_31705 [Nannocystaceae bacterium]
MHPSVPWKVPPVFVALALAAPLLACDSQAEVKAEASQEVAVQAEAGAEVDAAAGVAVAVNPEVVAEGKIEIKPADFKIEAVGAAIEAGEIESAAELEVMINAEASDINHLDVDLDGTIDHIQVVEVRAPTVVAEVDAEVDAEARAAVDVEAAAVASADVSFEFRVIPSSRATIDAGVVFASTAFVHHHARAELEVRTAFTAVVPQPEVHVHAFVTPFEFHAGVVVGGPALIAWAFAPARPVYVGTYDVDVEGRWIPPGHLKHGHWKATGDGPPGHGGFKGHGKVQGHGSVGGKGRGGFGGSVGGKSHGSVGGKGHGSSVKPSSSSHGGKSGGSSGKSGGGKSGGGKSGGSSHGGKSGGSSGKSGGGKSGGGKGKGH